MYQNTNKNQIFAMVNIILFAIATLSWSQDFELREICLVKRKSRKRHIMVFKQHEFWKIFRSVVLPHKIILSLIKAFAIVTAGRCSRKS